MSTSSTQEDIFNSLGSDWNTADCSPNCRHCREVVIDISSPRGEQTLPHTIDDALFAAQDGCCWWARIVLQIKISGKRYRELERDRVWLSLMCKDKRPDVGAMCDLHSVTISLGTGAYWWPWTSFHVHAHPTDGASAFVTTRPANTNVDSSATFETIRAWISLCQREHFRCQQEPQTDYGSLPKRLVDVEAYKDDVKLVETNLTSHKRYNYLALSYCWGGKQRVLTDTSNRTDHMVKIRVRSLARSIVDAIRVTRQLGFRFRWVDSLCLVQDDRVEMESEISKMPDIFEKAFLVISAASAKTSQQGFLYCRQPPTYSLGPYRLAFLRPDGIKGEVELFQQAEFNSKDEIINTRGWTLQESFMATRLLVYGNHCVRWSCMEAELSDGGPWGVSYDISFRQKWSGWKRVLNPNAHRYTGPKKIQELLDAWKKVVEEYSSRRFTFPRDRLPALSGISQKFSKAFENAGLDGKAIYRFGLWNHDLHRQLLWIPSVGNGSSSTHVLQDVSKDAHGSVPSWSWASVQDPVTFLPWDRIPTYWNLDPERPVSSRPELAGRGAQILSQEQNDSGPAGDGSHKSITESPCLLVRGRMLHPRCQLADGISWMLDGRANIREVSEQIPQGRIKLLEVIKRENSSKREPCGRVAPKGLILRKLEADGFYERVGVFDVERGQFDGFESANAESLIIV